MNGPVQDGGSGRPRSGGMRLVGSEIPWFDASCPLNNISERIETLGKLTLELAKSLTDKLCHASTSGRILFISQAGSAVAVKQGDESTPISLRNLQSKPEILRAALILKIFVDELCDEFAGAAIDRHSSATNSPKANRVALRDAIIEAVSSSKPDSSAAFLITTAKNLADDLVATLQILPNLDPEKRKALCDEVGHLLWRIKSLDKFSRLAGDANLGPGNNLCIRAMDKPINREEDHIISIILRDVLRGGIAVRSHVVRITVVLPRLYRAVMLATPEDQQVSIGVLYGGSAGIDAQALFALLASEGSKIARLDPARINLMFVGLVTAKDEESIWNADVVAYLDPILRVVRGAGEKKSMGPILTTEIVCLPADRNLYQESLKGESWPQEAPRPTAASRVWLSMLPGFLDYVGKKRNSDLVTIARLIDQTLPGGYFGFTTVDETNTELPLQEAMHGWLMPALRNGEQIDELFMRYAAATIVKPHLTEIHFPGILRSDITTLEQLETAIAKNTLQQGEYARIKFEIAPGVPGCNWVTFGRKPLAAGSLPVS